MLSNANKVIIIMINDGKFVKIIRCIYLILGEGFTIKINRYFFINNKKKYVYYFIVHAQNVYIIYLTLKLPTTHY